MKQYEAITFTKTATGIYPNKQLAKHFFITRIALARDLVEVEPLTVSRFIRAVTINFTTLSYYRLLNILWRLGFINASEYEVFSLKNLTLPFLNKR